MLLAKYNIKTIHIPVKKNMHMLRPIKDKLGLKIADIYCVPCECCKVYVGQTGRSIETRYKEHETHVWASQRSPLWQSINLIRDTTSISRAYPSCIRPWDTWTV
jgi:hypothetical protein